MLGAGEDEYFRGGSGVARERSSISSAEWRIVMPGIDMAASGKPVATRAKIKLTVPLETASFADNEAARQQRAEPSSSALSEAGDGNLPLMSVGAQAVLLCSMEKVCGCGTVHDSVQWRALSSVGVQDDPEEPLELRQCRCGSTIARVLSPPSVRRYRIQCADQE